MSTHWEGAERRMTPTHCQQEILDKLNRLILFIEGDGNGKPGARIILDRHERTLSVVIWAGALMVVGSLGFAGWMAQIAFSKVFGS